MASAVQPGGGRSPADFQLMTSSFGSLEVPLSHVPLDVCEQQEEQRRPGPN